ncbi:MAG: OB-fold domain-containing protein [Gammaproteobacteria bacterium]|nr:OB-fold domain-containing protein [Gammaproteobacteria bacterium]
MSKRPQPILPEPNTDGYWEGVKNHELRYQVCNDCTKVVFYPRMHCPSCLSGNLAWKRSKGEGSVYTYSVVMQNRVPGFVELGAYSVAYIDLDEGFRMLSSVVGVDNPTTDIHIGQRVKVDFEPQEDGEYPIPVFRPM